MTEESKIEKAKDGFFGIACGGAVMTLGAGIIFTALQFNAVAEKEPANAESCQLQIKRVDNRGAKMMMGVTGCLSLAFMTLGVLGYRDMTQGEKKAERDGQGDNKPDAPPNPGLTM